MTSNLNLLWITSLSVFLHVRGQTWHEFQGHCYTILNVKDKFDVCNLSCQQNGAYVVELEGQPELKFVQSLIDSSSDQYWVGLNYNTTNQNYYWNRDQKQPNNSMWHSSEPNQSGFCVRLRTEAQSTARSSTSDSKTFLLADNPCSKQFKVVCEKDTKMFESTTYREMNTSSSNRCPEVSYQAWSMLHCAINCSKNKSCIGFQYSDQNQTCTPYSDSATCSTTQVPTLTLYIRENARC